MAESIGTNITQDLEANIDFQKKEKNLLFQKNLSELTDSDLTKLGFLVSNSFYEEIDIFIQSNRKEYNKKLEDYIKNNNLNSDKLFKDDIFDINKIIIKNMENGTELIDKFQCAISKAIKVFKYMKKIEDIKEKIRRQKQIKSIKYNRIKGFLNYIEISVIIISAIVTFFEGMQTTLGIQDNIFFILIPAIASSYIGLIMAFSRFYKFSDQAENLLKIDEKQSLVINRLSERFNKLERIIPINKNTDLDEIDQIIDVDFVKDGLDDLISQTHQEYDLILSYIEKIKYKNKWIQLRKKEKEQNIRSKTLKSVFYEDNENIVDFVGKVSGLFKINKNTKNTKELDNFQNNLNQINKHQSNNILTTITEEQLDTDNKESL